MRTEISKNLGRVSQKRGYIYSMPRDSASDDFEMEIAHVLFVDVVGFTRLVVKEQSEVLSELNQVIRHTSPFQIAQAAGKLVRLPSGDGMALAFFTQPEAPVKCALEISEALKNHSRIHVRMGIHSGPVSAVTDVNDQPVVAGTGISMAQRVMDCGDAGHILLSQRIATDLGQNSHWTSHLFDLGEVEVKPDVKIGLVNLYTGTLGNPEVPEKLRLVRSAHVSKTKLPPPPAPPPSAYARQQRWVAAALLLFILAGVTYIVLSRRSRSTSPIIASSAPATSRALSQAGNKSIVVLPFENLNRDTESEFFADGVQDEIRTDLAKIADLKVISRISAMQFKTTPSRNPSEIAKALRVTHVLEGSVQRATNRVRVAVKLIDAGDANQLWTEQYDRPLEEIFALQSEIAKTVANQLRARISPLEKAAIDAPPTTNLAAYDLYNRARAIISTSAFGPRFREDLSQGERLLNDAVTRDPNYLMAYCELAGIHDYIYFYGIDHSAARLDLAQEAVTNALTLGPERGEAHLAKAQHLYRGYFDFEGARAELFLARRTLPNDPRIPELTGYIDRRQGRQEEALRNFERALDLDPYNFAILQRVAYSYGALRRYPEMIAVFDRALPVTPPEVIADTKIARAQVDLDWKANTKPLHAVIDEIFTQDPGALEGSTDNWLHLALCERDPLAAGRALAALGDNMFGPDAIQFTRDFGEGLVARMQGYAAVAQSAFSAAREHQEELVQDQGDYGPALCVLGLIDAALGRKDDAISEGQRAIDLLPLERDAVNGLHVRQFLAVIYAWTGEKELACQQLGSTLDIPGSASYGELRLHPYWDPLRGDSCFERIVERLAPKSP